MSIPRCQHVHVNGTQCGSPAIRGNRQCYFHSRHQLKPAQEGAFNFPTLEDANAIQVALMQVIRAIADNKIECKRAGLLLYALQTASYNLKRTKLEPNVEDIVLDTSSLQQEVTPPPDPVDAIRAMRRSYWKLHDPDLIQRDRDIVSRECSRATGSPVWPGSPTREKPVPSDSPTPVWPGSSTRDRGSQTRATQPADLPESTTSNSQPEPDFPQTENSQPTTSRTSKPETGNSSDPVLQFLAELQRTNPPEKPTTESPDEDDEYVTPEGRSIVSKFLSLLTGPEDRTTLL